MCQCGWRKLSDFFYLTEATPRQRVAYAATLLQEAAADWWVALLREHYGLRPEDFQEFSVLLEKRFGSSTRVDRAMAALRDIRQGQIENGASIFHQVRGIYWVSSLHLTRIGQKPNLFGVCTRVWPN